MSAEWFADLSAAPSVSFRLFQAYFFFFSFFRLSLKVKCCCGQAVLERFPFAGSDAVPIALRLAAGADPWPVIWLSIFVFPSESLLIRKAHLLKPSCLSVCQPIPTFYSLFSFNFLPSWLPLTIFSHLRSFVSSSFISSSPCPTLAAFNLHSFLSLPRFPGREILILFLISPLRHSPLWPGKTFAWSIWLVWAVRPILSGVAPYPSLL